MLVNLTRKKTFSNNPRYWYKRTTTKTTYDICVYSSWLKSSINVLSLLERKKKDDEQLCVGSKTLLEYLALHKRILEVLKIRTYTDATVKNVYTVISAWKFETMKKNWRFCWDCLWDSILPHFQLILHSYKLISKRSSSTHNSSYWWVNNTFWTSEDSPFEVGSTEYSCHLFLRHI